MGLYRVTIEATGGHGCQREVGDGGTVFGCRRMECPDCMVVEFVENMKRMGQHISKAELVHWPDAAQWGGTSVIDEIVPSSQRIVKYTRDDEDHQYIDFTPVHRIRHGNF